MRRVLSLLVAVACAAGFVADAAAEGRGGGLRGGGGGMRTPKEPYEVLERKGLFATGLRAAFPAGVDCPGIASPYGSRTRYDGSARNNDHYGYHNGLDITLRAGTPLLAVADGTVVHAGTAGQLVGHFVWLHFAPAATGLPVHLFARYQHLDEPSPLAVGTTVEAGDVIARSGNTGTAGGHYGSAGYPHLHINFLVGDSAEHTVKGPMLGPKSLRYLDPLGLYLVPPPSPADNHALRDLPDAAKTVAVPVRTTDGRTLPAGSRTVWPVACSPR
ncbi:M23 family metallopeptidase [Thalassobaculum fulvum]|nr:M23 family metallopeptidase [Thalassobaculum fulvum]